MKTYTDDQFIDIYDYIVGKKDQEFEEEFPELVPYKDTLYYVLNTCFKKYAIYGGRYSIISWLSGILSYIKKTNNKEFYMDDEIVKLLGKLDVKVETGTDYKTNVVDFFQYYITLFYPEDMINYSFYFYIYYFYRIFARLLSRDDIKKDNYKKYPRIMALLEIMEELKTNLHYSCLPDDYQELLKHLLACCYSNGTDYTMIYNYLKDPKAYIDKIVVKGYGEYEYNFEFTWTAESDPLTFDVAKKVFEEEEQVIR